MKRFIVPALVILSGCANINPTKLPLIQTRQAIHAELIAQARETLREAQEWRALGDEAPAR